MSWVAILMGIALGIFVFVVGVFTGIIIMVESDHNLRHH